MLDTPLSILIVEDDEDYAQYLEAMLPIVVGVNKIDIAATVDEAKKLLREQPYHVCFLDYRLPDGTGLDVLRDPLARDVGSAFIFLTAHSENQVAREALELGAMDFLIKARFNDFDLEKAISYSLYRKTKEQEMRTAALHDPLTGLGNRTLFDEQMKALCGHAQRSGDRIAVIFIDLDGFKPINDTHGHAVGDEVLIEVAHRLKRLGRKSDLPARLGGDEFAMILSGIPQRDAAEKVVEKVRTALSIEPVETEAGAIAISASVGVALYPDAGENVVDVLKAADDAMYSDKSRKKSR